MLPKMWTKWFLTRMPIIWAISKSCLWCIESLDDSNIETAVNMKKLQKQKSQKIQRKVKQIQYHKQQHRFGRVEWLRVARSDKWRPCAVPGKPLVSGYHRELSKIERCGHHTLERETNSLARASHALMRVRQMKTRRSSIEVENVGEPTGEAHVVQYWTEECYSISKDFDSTTYLKNTIEEDDESWRTLCCRAGKHKKQINCL